MSWIEAKARELNERTRTAQEKQVYPYFRIFRGGGGLHTHIDDKPVTLFSSNDYLGLTTHPKVKEAAARAAQEYACGLSSSRPQATTIEHVRFEERMAKWMGFEACLCFTTGYQAMVGIISALADKDTTLVLDAYSHACILDGSFLAAGVPKNGAEIRFFNHNSSKSLERILNTPSHHRVHHGSNPRYLDRNYGGILIIWDRMFGSFQPELDEEAPRYGLVHNLGTFNILRVAFHEWIAIAQDLVREPRHAAGWLFGPPGWSPDGSRETSTEIKAKWAARRGAAEAKKAA